MDVSPISFPLIPLSMGTTRPKESEKPIPDDLILRELSYVKKHLLPYSAHALAAHILGGAHVSGLLIDKQEVEGFPQGKMLGYVSQKMGEIAQKLEITDDPIVANYLKELSSLEAVDREHGKIFTAFPGPENEQRRCQVFSKSIVKRLQALKTDESLLLQGGWTNPQEPGGHAMLYRLTRRKDGQYTFALYNSGDGLQYHPIQQSQNQLLFAQELHCTVAAEQVLNPVFWQGYYQLQYAPGKKSYDIAAEELYQWLNSLEESFLEKSCRETLKKDKLQTRRGQRSGNCTFESFLTYTKAQFSQNLPLYHQLKGELQVAVLDDYWAFLKKEILADPKEPIDPKVSQKTLQILDLVAKEIGNVESTFLKQLKKRVRKEDEDARKAIEETRARLQEKRTELEQVRKKHHDLLRSLVREPFSEEQAPIVLQSPEVAPVDDFSVKKGYFGMTLSKSRSERFKEVVYEYIEKMADSSASAENKQKALGLIHPWANPSYLLALEDSCWEEVAPKIFVPFIEALIENIFSFPPSPRDCLSGLKSLAIVCKLAQHCGDPILEKCLIDRRFIRDFIREANAQVLVALSQDESEEFQKHIKFLHERSKENGVFHEFFSQDDLDFSKKGQVPDSIKDVALKYLGDPSFESVRKEHFKELGDNPKEEHLLGWFLWKKPYPTYRVMSQFLFKLRQCVFYEGYRSSNLGVVWVRHESNLCDKPTKFTLDLDDKSLPFRLLDAFAIQQDKQQEFVRWLTPASEMDLRKEAGTRKGMDWLEFQLRLIRSSDDPVLRIPRAIEFFTLHPQFLQRPECQKYLLSTFFQVSLQDGSCAWREYLKNTPQTGVPLAMQFIQQGLEKFSDHAEVFCFFLEMGLFMSNHLSQEQQKNIVLFPKPVFDSLSRLLRLQTDPNITERLLTCFADIAYPVEFIPIELNGFKKRWPFLVPNTKFSDLHLDQMSPEQRSQTLSLYLFGRDFGDTWEYKGFKAICGNYTVDMQNGEIWYRGYSLTRKEYEETSTVPWKQNFPSSNTRVIGYNSEHFFSILRDKETGQEYLLQREEKQQRFYQKSGDRWLPLIPIGQLEHLPIFSQLGISAKNGWTAIYENGITVLQDKNKIARFWLTKEGVREARPPHLFALDPSKNEGNIFYTTCREMDPRVQLWGEKGEEDSYQVKRLDFPTLGLQFAVQEKQIVGKGEWEGFILEPDCFLPSLSQLHHKLVLRSQKTGERVVIIPQGKATSSKDMTVPMSLGFDTGAKLHVFSLQKNGRLKATDRSGCLYLASLYFHMKQPRLACACLKKGHTSAPYETSELVQVKMLLEEAKKSDTIDAISVALHAFLALEKSLHLPWKKPANLEETEQQTRVTTCITDVPSIQKLFSRYQERIAHVSEGCRIHKEDLERLQQRFPSPTGYFSVSVEITFSDLSEKELLGILLHCDPEEVDLDLFSKRVVPIRGAFAEVAPHFLSLYAIAKAGSPLQQKQLLTWLVAVRAMKHGQDDSQFGSLVDFLRKILSMEEKERSILPTPGALKAFTVKEFTPLVKAVHKMVLPKSSPVQTQPSPKFTKHTKSLRKDLLRPSSLPIDRIHSSCLKKWTKDKEIVGPLFDDSPFTQQLISAFPQPPLSIAGLDQGGGRAYKKAFESLQASAEAYQAKAAKEEVWEIAAKEQVAVYRKVEAEMTQVKTQFRERKKALLAKVRSPSFLLGKDLLIYQLEQASGIRDTLRWSDLLALFAKQDANAYCAQIPALTKEQAEEIYQETARCLMQQVELQRLEQAKSILVGKKPGELLPKEELEGLPTLSSEQVKELHRLLWEKRPNYPMDRYPAILLFEAISGMLLRPDQLENLEKLADPTQDVLLEAIMGSGKSEVLLPLFAQTIADGEHLGLLVLPKEQMQSGGVRLERRLRDIFEKEGVQLNWEDVSLTNLQAILARLQEARTKGQVVWLYADQLQHFFLQEKSALQRHFSGDKEAIKALPVFQEIRKLLREKGVALVDEAHLQLMRKRECQKPLGSKCPLDAAFREAACDLQLLLLTDETICKRWFFQTSRPGSMAGTPFLKEVHQKRLRKALAKAFVAKRYTKEEDTDVAKKVLSFLRASEADVGSLLQTLPEAEREVLAFVRGQIWTILPTTLSKKWGEEYGLFPPREKEGTTTYLAGPYRSSEPVYGSTFATPDEQLAFTIQSYLMTGVPEDILKEFLTDLQLAAKQKSLSFHQPIELTEECLWYQQFVGELSKESPFTQPNYALLAEATRRDPVRLRSFLMKFVLPKIEYYPETAVENGYSFVRHLKTVKAVSGTFYAPFTLHHRFSWALRPEIEGEGFVLLTKEKEPILLTEKIEGIPLLEKLFRENSGVTPRAIVDQGGLIKEDPSKIAKAILEYTKKADPRVDRVIYFDKNEQMVLERNVEEPKKYSSTSAPPETSFTFYDQSHATGTDIPQDSLATALVTVHETTPLAYLLQAAFRMRQIAKEQSVRFVASYPLTATIKSLGKKEITSDDLLCYAKHIQTTTTLEENYKTVLEQLKEIFLEECEKLLDRRLDKKVFVMMIRKNPFDPIASWATSSCMTEPEFVFRKVKEMLMGQLKTHLTSEEVGNVEKRMETLIQRALKKDDCQVPDHVSSQQAFSEGREAELQREQVQEQQQQSVQEQQQQQQQMQTIHLSQGGSSSTHQIPLFDPDLFVRCDLQNRCSLKQVPDQDDAEGVTIYSARAFLEGSCPLGAFLEKLPAKLLFSRDVVGGVSGTIPFGPNRKAIGGVLRVPDLTDPNKEPYMIVLSKKESQKWVDAIAKRYAPVPFDQAVLCSLTLDAFYQKGVLAQGESLEGGESVEKLVALQQNFAVEKWLMGEIYAYTPDELEKLSTWIRGFKDVAALEKLFLEKFLLSEEREFYSVSPLRKIFEAAIPKPIAPPAPIQPPQEPISKKIKRAPVLKPLPAEPKGKKAKELSFFQRLRSGKIVKSLVLFPFRVVVFPFWFLWRLFLKKK